MLAWGDAEGDAGSLGPGIADRPTVCAGYEIVRRLGQGRTGSVHLARRGSSGRLVALKLFHPRATADERLLRRFIREAHTAGRLAHPGIAPALEFGEVDGTVYTVSEHLPGGSLADLLVAHGPLVPEEIARAGSTVASALAMAHGEGIVHNGVKPANILIDARGEPRLTDFGVGHLPGAVDPGGAHEGVVRARHAAPELVGGGGPTPATDIYALAAALYEGLTGRPPFDPAGDQGVMDKHPTGTVPALPAGIPGRLAEAVLQGLAKQPGDRHRDVAAFAAALAAAARHRSLWAAPPAARRASSWPAPATLQATPPSAAVGPAPRWWRELDRRAGPPTVSATAERTLQPGSGPRPPRPRRWFRRRSVQAVVLGLGTLSGLAATVLMALAAPAGSGQVRPTGLPVPTATVGPAVSLPAGPPHPVTAAPAPLGLPAWADPPFSASAGEIQTSPTGSPAAAVTPAVPAAPLAGSGSPAQPGPAGSAASAANPPPAHETSSLASPSPRRSAPGPSPAPSATPTSSPSPAPSATPGRSPDPSASPGSADPSPTPSG